MVRKSCSAGSVATASPALNSFSPPKLGLPPWVAVLAGLVEFGGGLLLALGLVTRVAAALVVGLMTVAIIQVHWSNGFFWTQGGYEYPLLWGILALSFVIRGGGRFSLDALIGREIGTRGERRVFACLSCRRPRP